ncbi:glycerol kinase [Dongia mobilis]|uniref:ATP:glycerol 3-phosphotransferase n=1 Tax=Dongia mobilis TaxID=578943 RepID=A0A4V3DEN7_9PROT|nr:FGGY family carbohydrate kinase [Dongia mobilis]TDQ81421.1 glycerol kinase [Dongia mobilis]
MAIVAIDQGTTSTRALLVADDGGARIVHSEKHRQILGADGRVEHDPEELIAHIQTCLAAAGKAEAIGIDNQGESCLAWDAMTGEAISPVIVWQDARTMAEIEKLKSAGAETETLTRAGLPLDAYFSATKLRWLLDHVPAAGDLLKQRRLRLGTTDAFFLQRLTGTCATDATTASRTSLMNLATGEWDPVLCDLFGVPMETLPPIRPTIGEFGTIGGVPVTASMVDQQAALYGHGCRNTGDAKITFGTGAFALALTGSEILRRPDQGLLPTLAWQFGGERTYAVDGGVYNAGSAVDWLLKLGLVPDMAALNRFEGVPAIARELVFVPALSGLACPHWDRGAAGLWLGMGLETTPADLARSVIEGIALRTAEVVATMAGNITLDARISVDGGLTRNPYFLQFLADVTGRELVTRGFDELTAFGCAAFAGRAVGRDLELPPGATTVVAPGQDSREYCERFADAVARAKSWRRV